MKIENEYVAMGMSLIFVLMSGYSTIKGNYVEAHVDYIIAAMFWCTALIICTLKKKKIFIDL